MTAAMALAASAARAGLVSCTVTLTMLIGDVAVFDDSVGVVTETLPLQPAPVSPRPTCAATRASVLSALTISMAARGSVLMTEIGLPLASVGWPR